MKSAKDKRAKRQIRIRKKVMGTAERPRLSIFKSSKHIYAQVIDDVNGKTLAAASTVGKGAVAKTANIDGAKSVGSAIAERAKSNNVTTVVFDRGGFKYHGRVKALADAAREKGLKF